MLPNWKHAFFHHSVRFMQLRKCLSSDFNFATPLPDIVEDYYFVHDKNWFVKDPYSDYEIFDRSKINVTVAVYKKITNTLFIYTYNEKNILEIR